MAVLGATIGTHLLRVGWLAGQAAAQVLRGREHRAALRVHLAGGGSQFTAVGVPVAERA
ncbi:MAG: hypothetical protein ACRDR6_10390 [Pseudonocardiaceae bacterium]